MMGREEREDSVEAWESTAYQQSLALLRECLTPAGFVAAAQDVENYARIWARDGVIAGLAGLVSEDSALIEGMEHTLDTLAKYQGPHGEIPSNVSIDGDIVSYGRLTGRVDALLWYVIGVCAYLNRTKHKSRKVHYWLTIEKALFLVGCWEFNNRGLLYTPLSGNWADEYVQQGYVLADQLLYEIALRGAGMVFNNKEWSKKADYLRSLLTLNYWPRPLTDAPEEQEALIYHTHAYNAYAHRNDITYWLPALSPAGYATYFDGLAHALALVTELGDEQQRAATERYIQSLEIETGSALLPAFWPVIQPDDPQWSMLEANHLYGQIKNQPYQYHNGGLWPVLNGFYALGLAEWGMTARAEKVLRALHQANEQGSDGRQWDFAEYHHGQSGAPMGTRHQAWSAAAGVIAQQAVRQGVYPWPLAND